MVYRSFLKLLLVVIPASIVLQAAGNTIKGYVFDIETGFGIPEVQIFTSDSSQGVVSDPKGYFTLTGIQTSKARLIFKHVKYHTIKREINFHDSHEIFNTFYLSANTMEMDSVVVVGRPFFPGRNTVSFSPIRSLFYSKRYMQYKQMLKKGDWSWLELKTYGFWSIAAPKVFEEFWALKSRRDRETFLQLFWQNNDPTPGTAKNELKEEFERRIRYNWTHFSKVDSFGISQKDDALDKSLKFLFGKNAFKSQSENRLRPWTKRAPWDARGEIYLKYGEPKQKTFNDLDHVNWYYPELGIDFSIEKFATNIQGNEIMPGERTMQQINNQTGVSIQSNERNILTGERMGGQSNRSRGDLMNVQNELNILLDEFREQYVDNNTFYYNHEHKRRIPDFKYYIRKSFSNLDENFLRIQFQPEYFQSIKNDSYYAFVTAQMVLKTMDGEIVMTESLPGYRTIEESSGNKFSLDFPLEIEPGDYKLELYVEDHNAKASVTIEDTITLKENG